MNKLLAIALIPLLSSCASIDYSYFSDFKRLFTRNAIEVSDSYVGNAKYSFIKVSHSRNDAIFVLSEVSPSGIYSWIGSNYEVIKTKHGLIVETQGLDYDIKFYSLDFNDVRELCNYSSYINLYNPDLVYAKITFNGEDGCVTYDSTRGSGSDSGIVKLERQVSSIAWSSKDTYVYRDGVVIKSIQRINPLRDPFFIEFYYKY